MTLLAGLLVLFGVLATFRAPFELLLGWVSFLMRVLPKVSADGPSLIVGCAAFVLFTVGVHWAGRSWRRKPVTGDDAAAQPWKIRWSLAVVAVVCVLFAAGVSLVGATHQLVWLLTSDRPLVVETSEEGAVRSETNLKMIGEAASGPSDEPLPPGGTFAPDGTMLHSWETFLLPRLFYSSGSIDRSRAWNDPKNARYFKCIIPEFINSALRMPELFDAEGYGLSHYAANIHVVNGNKPMKRSDLPNGTSNTFLVGEVNAQFKPWGHPVNWRDPARGINRSPYGFGGAPGTGGANFAMADGSVRFVSEKVSPDVLRAASGRQQP
jgi:prepilin-type processing-associated H-X9-DG protein